MEVQAKPPTTKGPTDWFTGDVYVDPIAQNQGPSPMSVDEVPGERPGREGAATLWEALAVGGGQSAPTPQLRERLAVVAVDRAVLASEVVKADIVQTGCLP